MTTATFMNGITSTVVLRNTIDEEDTWASLILKPASKQNPQILADESRPNANSLRAK